MIKTRPNISRLASLAFLFLCYPGLLYAQDNPNDLSETTSLLLAIFKVVGSLAVVVALMLAFVFLIKKIGLNQGLRETSLIRVLDNKMVAPKKYIAIVEIAGKTVSLGVTDHSINLLTEIEPSAVSNLDSSSSVSSPASLPKQFADLLAKATGRHSLKMEKNDK